MYKVTIVSLMLLIFSSGCGLEVKEPKINVGDLTLEVQIDTETCAQIYNAAAVCELSDFPMPEDTFEIFVTNRLQEQE